MVAAGFTSASTPRERKRDDEEAAPRRGWWDVLQRVYARIAEDRVTSIAAGVAFFALLAIFPALGALVSIYGLFSDASTLGDQIATLAAVLPGGAIDLVAGELQRLTAQGSATLGTTFLAGLALSLWSANAGTKALIDALNIVYDETETRGLIALNALSLAFTIGGIVLILLALAAMVVLPAAFGYVGLAEKTELLVKVLRWPALALALAFALAVIYRFGPDRRDAKWRWITWGSASAALAWVGASMLFSWYAENFGSYNATYGALGAVIGFMTWLWISNIVILAGAELDAELECQDPAMRGRVSCGSAETAGLPAESERADR
jgi:membrane protein